ncbi:hypothetical protein LEO2_57 [Bacillus phage Leo2]|uniref:Uncharacterized protein n=1 Tax=Bacillus phage Leo2 TaxID=1815973 RepID=A0A1S5QTS3_9CAUD|nr:hypothetical protein LEO2_57 [Bacillus phage Leo2]
MSKIRTIVLPYEQSEALKHMIKKIDGLTDDPVQRREKMADFIIDNHGSWQGTFKPLNKVPFNDLLYIATGGAWEVQKTIRSVIEELRDDYKKCGVTGAVVALNVALEKLKKEGFIQ